MEHIGLFDTPPTRREVRLALAVVTLLIVAFLAVLPFSARPAGETVAFVPVVDAVVFVGELIIATLLYSQAVIFRSRALTVLASGFVFISLLLIPHALTFPGAFAQNGLLDPGVSSAAWVMIFRRLGFPLMVIFYALAKKADQTTPPEATPARSFLWVSGAVTLALALSALAIDGDRLLPAIFVNRSDADHLNLQIFNVSNIAIILAAIAVLFLRRNSVLDMWLQVALAGWLIQSLLNLSLDARFTVGWYCLFLVILLSHLCMLLALIAESNRLYERLALSTAVRDREREGRMMSMEGVAAAISHEIGQPLAAVNLSAASGLRQLTRAEPNTEGAIQSLHDTLEAGQRAFEVMKSIRASFTNGRSALSQVDPKELVEQTVQLVDRELAARKISLRMRLDDAPAIILANRVQLQRVLINLLTNAMEAMEKIGPSARRISINSTMDDENVLFEISDTGVGIASTEMSRIFDPFFTTKSTGTGLGLSLSRTIVEEHKGRLWASQREGSGTTFHLLLPVSGPIASG